jgi:hypothetical protein
VRWAFLSGCATSLGTMAERKLIRSASPLLAILCVLALSGCLSALTLNKAVISYDDAVTDSLSKQLLINIARAQHHQPIHFTGVSNVAATFDFRTNAGFTPALTGESGKTLLPLFGGSVAENPTISIAPIEGEEFTKRLLTPFEEIKLMLLLRQGVDIDLLLRLMAKELRVKEGGREIAYRNLPSDRAGYEMFRRVVLHLSAIQDQNRLYAEPLVFERAWTIPAESITAEGFKALEQDYLVTYDRQAKTYALRKKVIGRILVTNYDPDTLSFEERARLSYEAEDWPPNDLTFDIRPGHPGGEWPIKGDFRLRSFHAILTALGRSLEDEAEYHVDKDPRSPSVLNNENPVSTLELVVSETPPLGADLSVRTHGKFYAVKADGPLARWNRLVFQLLYLLFQMTVSEVPKAGVPSITIAK